MLFVLLSLFVSLAQAETTIWVPNIPGDITGTQSGGHNGLDVNINSGGIPIVIPTASPLPVTFPTPLPVTIVSPSPLPINGNVQVTLIPGVAVTSIPSVAVTSIPSVAVTSIPGVSITNTPTVIISPTPLPVTFSGTPTITISPTPLPISGPINANSTLSSRQTVTGTESNLIAPSNTVGILVECESVNADNLRYGFSNSATAILSTTLGMLCEPGRDAGYLPLGSGNYLHMISDGAGSDYIDVLWVKSQ